MIGEVDADGNVGLVIDVPLGDLRGGANTLEMLPLNLPMDYPPTIANINLTVRLGATGPTPTAPTNLRIIRALLLSPASLVQAIEHTFRSARRP